MYYQLCLAIAPVLINSYCTAPLGQMQKFFFNLLYLYYQKPTKNIINQLSATDFAVDIFNQNKSISEQDQKFQRHAYLFIILVQISNFEKITQQYGKKYFEVLGVTLKNNFWNHSLKNKVSFVRETARERNPTTFPNSCSHILNPKWLVLHNLRAYFVNGENFLHQLLQKAQQIFDVVAGLLVF